MNHSHLPTPEMVRNVSSLSSRHRDALGSFNSAEKHKRETLFRSVLLNDGWLQKSVYKNAPLFSGLLYERIFTREYPCYMGHRKCGQEALNLCLKKSTSSQRSPKNFKKARHSVCAMHRNSMILASPLFSQIVKQNKLLRTHRPEVAFLPATSPANALV